MATTIKFHPLWSQPKDGQPGRWSAEAVALQFIEQSGLKLADVRLTEGRRFVWSRLWFVKTITVWWEE